MTRILFVCHGNICRSPMAEFVFAELVRRRGLEDAFFAASAATSTEEIGNPVHYGTLRVLAQNGFPTPPHRAVQITKADYAAYDHLVAMDSFNVRNLLRVAGPDTDGKLRRLLDFTDEPGDVADPWYTGDYETAYRDILRGCESLLEFLTTK